MNKAIMHNYCQTVMKASHRLRNIDISKHIVSCIAKVYELSMTDKSIMYNMRTFALYKYFNDDLGVFNNSYAYYAFLIEPLTILVEHSDMAQSDECKEELNDYINKYNSIIQRINYYGDIITEFLVQVCGYSIVGYFGDKRIIVTSEDYPEEKFAKEIHDGYVLDVLPRIESTKYSYEEVQPKRKLSVNVVLRNKKFGTADFFFPRETYVPSDEDRRKTRQLIKSIYNN